MSVRTLLTYPLALPCARAVPQQFFVQAIRLCRHREAPKEPFSGIANQAVAFGKRRTCSHRTLAGTVLDAERRRGIFTGGNPL